MATIPERHPSQPRNQEGEKHPLDGDSDGSAARQTCRRVLRYAQRFGPGYLNTQRLQDIFAGKSGRQESGFNVIALGLRFLCENVAVAFVCPMFLPKAPEQILNDRLSIPLQQLVPVLEPKNSPSHHDISLMGSGEP